LKYKKNREKTEELISFFGKPIGGIIQYLNGISNREYRRLFKRTSLERLGRIGLLKNLKTMRKNFLP